MIEEGEPSKEFVKGYNHGYQLAKNEPELLDILLKAQSGNDPNDYSRAMEKGKDQYKQEQMVAEMKSKREQRKHTVNRRR